MNQINPLHIGALLVVILIFLFSQLSSVKEELKDANTEYLSSEKIAVAVSGLKSVYANKKKTQRALDRIFVQSSLRSAGLKIKKTKESVKVSAESVDSNVLNSLMGKILNGSYKITHLKIKRLSETQASLEMEIKL